MSTTKHHFRVVHRAKFGDRVMRVVGTYPTRDWAEAEAQLEGARLRWKGSRCFAAVEERVNRKWVQL